MSILKVSINQIKAGRALVEFSQERLAEASGVSLPTIKRLEAAGGEIGGRQGTADKLISALEAAGVIFIDENGEGPGVRLRKAPPGGERTEEDAELDEWRRQQDRRDAKPSKA